MTAKAYRIWIVLPLLLLLSLTAIAYWMSTSGDVSKTYTVSNELAIPRLINGTTADELIEIAIEHSTHEFFAGVESETRGFGQSYLGPTILLRKGFTTRIAFTNRMDQPTTVHGHGLHVGGEVDGGPQGRIEPGATRTVDLPIVQQAGTSWYHPHLMGLTAEHVHAGLAGMYIIEDDNSQRLPLPKTYGVDDIPLIVQDRTFIDGRMQEYSATPDQLMDGVREETLVVNGTVGAYHVAPQGWVRLRLLNGSNARFYRFFLSDNSAFYKIATEGGFLEAPVELTELSMAPGERNEIMVDLSAGSTQKLMAEFLPSDPGDAGFFAQLLAPSNPMQTVLELRPDSSIPTTARLPDKLNQLSFFTEEDQAGAFKRDFHLEMDMADDAGAISMENMLSISGASMDMGQINHRVRKGVIEEWTVTAEMMPHPFHVHGVSFQVLQHNGQPPSEADRGWKDTIVVTEQPTVLLMRFEHEASEQFPYMYHCHILEHEDVGMMGQFTVQ